MTGSGFELPALGGLVAAIRLMLEGAGIPKARRRDWFNEHINGSYELLYNIHREYIQKFQEAATLLKSRGDVRKAIELLREERPRNRMDRTGASELIKSLRNEVMPRNPFPKTKKVPSELKQLFSMYVFSYEQYLNSASPLDPAKNQTWYSYFIDTFARAVEAGRNPYEESYTGRAQGQDIVDDAATILERAVNETMPDAFQKVQERYMALRAYCLAAKI
jgi:hypothetical protein